ncbi:MAG TPA: STAS domain-containing protein [Chthoniobacterales bacterium]|jgi:anti-anti-sigma factor
MIIRFSGDSDLVASLAGRLDANSSATFEKEMLAGIPAATKSLTLDFSGVEYMSSAGLRAILGVTRKATGLRIAFCGMSGTIREIFEISGLHVLAPIYPDRAAAQQALAS